MRNSEKLLILQTPPPNISQFFPLLSLITKPIPHTRYSYLLCSATWTIKVLFNYPRFCPRYLSHHQYDLGRNSHEDRASAQALSGHQMCPAWFSAMDTEAQRVSREFKSHLESPLPTSIAICWEKYYILLKLKTIYHLCVHTNTS